MLNHDKLIRSSLGITIAVLIGYIISFAKEAVFAAYYGVSFQADAYVISMQIPVVLFAIVAVGIKTATLPIYTKRLLEVNKEHATLFASNLLTLSLIISSCFAVLGIVLADGIVYLFAPGFDDPTHSLAVNLLKISFPVVIFTIQADIYSTIMNAWKIFFLPQIASYFQNIMLIAVILLLTSSVGIYAAIIGTLLGTIVQCFYLVLISRKHFCYHPYVDLKDADILHAGKMAIPVTIGIGIAEINRFINIIIASGLSVGSLASLNYASKLSGIFSGLLVQVIATVVFPSFAELVVKKDYYALNRLINSILSMLIIIIFPVTVVLILYSTELVSIVFERGFFDKNAVSQTGSIFIFYIIGLLFVTVREIISKVYYSFHDTKTPMVNAAIGVAVNILLNIILGQLMGAPGLAFATSISSAIICGLLLFNLKNKFTGYSMKEAKTVLVKTVVATIGMISVLLIFEYLISISNPFLYLLCHLAVGAVTYLVLMYMLRTKEVLALLGMVMEYGKCINMKSMWR